MSYEDKEKAIVEEAETLTKEFDSLGEEIRLRQQRRSQIQARLLELRGSMQTLKEFKDGEKPSGEGKTIEKLEKAKK